MRSSARARSRSGSLPLLLPLPAVDDQGESEGQDDDEEHQGAEADSPAGTVAPHDGDLDAGSVEARISIAPLRVYHRREPLSHVPDSVDVAVPPALDWLRSTLEESPALNETGTESLRSELLRLVEQVRGCG
jgi:hypothetical protein